MFPFPFKLNGIWPWWQFSFRFLTKWKSTWFKIERKIVATIISHSMWKEMEIYFSQCVDFSGWVHEAGMYKRYIWNFWRNNRNRIVFTRLRLILNRTKLGFVPNQNNFIKINHPNRKIRRKSGFVRSTKKNRFQSMLVCSLAWSSCNWIDRQTLLKKVYRHWKFYFKTR